MEAAQEEFADGHAGNEEAAADDSEGLLTKLILPYWVTKLLKSSLGVAVVPSDDMLTIPNCPAELEAGKYEKARPPLHISVIGEAKSVPVSVHTRTPGLQVSLPNSELQNGQKGTRIEDINVQVGGHVVPRKLTVDSIVRSTRIVTAPFTNSRTKRHRGMRMGRNHTNYSTQTSRLPSFLNWTLRDHTTGSLQRGQESLKARQWQRSPREQRTKWRY